MQFTRPLGRALVSLAFAFSFSLFVALAHAADPPKPQDGVWVVNDFKFHTGAVLPALRLAYTTLGDPKNEAVLVLHGTTGNGAGMLNPNFGGELFGEGQPLDANKFFIILPDAIGTGKSSKPSDGLRAAFPRYNYDDMVDAQYRLVTEHLKIKRMRVVIGNSMGGMNVWLWAQKYPDAMDIAVPMASQPVVMGGRNWMLRRMLTESIRRDPAWQGGNYTQQPPSLQFASVFYGAATIGGNQGLYKVAATRERADALVNQRLTAPFVGDANDHLYQWESSADYDPSKGLERISAAVLAINSADDERNPPELGVMEREMKRIKNARLLIVPGSADTFGHGTTAFAKFWKKDLAESLQTAPRLGK